MPEVSLLTLTLVEYEVKSLIMDFDKIARKQSARLKKAKYSKLLTRQQLLIKHGLRSRERISKYLM